MDLDLDLVLDLGLDLALDLDLDLVLGLGLDLGLGPAQALPPHPPGQYSFSTPRLRTIKKRMLPFKSNGSCLNLTVRLTV